MNILWQQVQQLITNTTNKPFIVKKQWPISGGDVNQAFGISDGENCYFVKLNQQSAYDMFVQEAKGLAALAECKALVVPKVIGYGSAQSMSYLVLEHLYFAKRCNEIVFAKALANLHLKSANSHVSQTFGFEEDNFIGRTLQINTWHDNWGAFFTQCRLKSQLDILRKQGKNAKWMDDLERNFAKVSDILTAHKPQASLLHGDLWQGNYDTLADGRSTLFDPAVYYGDSEADLAMMTLFGRPSDEFFDTYQQIKPIPSGFELRRTIYNLYHILNHANLFGDSYLYQAESMVGEVFEA